MNKITNKTKRSEQNYQTALLIALQSDNENNPTNDPNNSFTNNLATALTALELNTEGNNISEIDFNKKQLHWVSYLEETKKQLNEAIRTFESYDQKGLLTTFFQKIKTKQMLKSHFLSKNFDTLFQYAFEAFKNETWNDVYFMSFFITVYFPTHVKPYLFLAKATEETKGIDQASEFYRISCETLKDPELYFFAAECELRRDHKDKTKEYLLKIKEILDNSASLNEEQQELLSDTNEILQSLEQAA